MDVSSRFPETLSLLVQSLRSNLCHKRCANGLAQFAKSIVKSAAGLMMTLGPNFIELLKQKKPLSTNNLLTRIMLPVKLPCHMYSFQLVTCLLCYKQKIVKQYFLLKGCQLYETGPRAQ